MSPRNRIPLKRRRFGKRLRKLREQVGLTQDEVGQRMRYSDSKISRFEAGQLVDYHVLTAMLDLYGLTVPEWAPWLAEWERSREPGWWAAYHLDDQGYVSMEDEAESITSFEPAFIPGLLQTEAYARAAFVKSSMSRSRQTIEKQIMVRMIRQARLFAELPLLFEVIIQERALYRSDLEPALHRAQLRQIIERAALTNVTVRVLPEVAGTHDGLISSLTLLRFPDKEESDIAYTEHILGSIHSDDPSHVATAKLTIDHLIKLALDPVKSIELIEQVAASM
jgi:transcriptional regulator with XRE-family HTH domain